MYIEILSGITLFLIAITVMSLFISECPTNIAISLLFGLISTPFCFWIYLFCISDPIIMERKIYETKIKDNQAYIIDYDRRELVYLNYRFNRNIEKGTKIEKQIYGRGPYYGIYYIRPEYKYVILEDTNE